jgi:L-aminopeptidase/D-esterase-like protein
VSLTDVVGVRVGHWTDPVARTGCTVVLLPDQTVVSGEVRGSAPATRELALLAPERTVQHAHAFVLSGGSAFGLACADGVMRWLEAHGIGFETRWARVPIVAALACFDLGVGDPTVRPGPDEGWAACEAATPDAPQTGAIGAGTGCTIGKWNDPDAKADSGLGAATLRYGDLVVSALVACNAVGYVNPPGQREPLVEPFWARDGANDADSGTDADGAGTNTSIGVVLTNARLDKVGCLTLAQSGHDGLARAIDPAHTGLDGDALLSGATGQVDADRDLVRAIAARAVEDAVRRAAAGPP